MNVSLGAKVREGRVRVFRDPKTGGLKLRIQGAFGFPGSSEEPFLSLETFLDINLEEVMAVQLRDQLLAFAGEPEDEEPKVDPEARKSAREKFTTAMDPELREEMIMELAVMRSEEGKRLTPADLIEDLVRSWLVERKRKRNSCAPETVCR